MKETMNIFTALCELKVLDSRISEKSAKQYVAAKTASTEKIGNPQQTVENFVKNAKANYDSLADLMKRRVAIKNAIAVSNAKTVITVANKEMTVAEAIEMRANGIHVYRRVRDNLVSQLNNVTHSANVINDNLLEKANDYVARLFSAKEKAMTEEMLKMRDAYVKANTVEVVDPVELESKIQKMTEFIDAFDAEIDSKLSVSNALTLIEIEY